jgi:homogentisate 1,2-dioxygenase
MPIYHRLGRIPRKRHTVFRQENGQLYSEHLMGSLGFSGPASLLYHIHKPTSVLKSHLLAPVRLEPDPEAALRMRHFALTDVPPAASLTLGRTPVLFNADVVLSLVTIVDGAAVADSLQDNDAFYRNGQADEIVYVSDGQGVLESEFGDLPFRRGDYLVIPRGILHRYRPQLEHGQPLRLLIVEGRGHVTPPKRYCNDRGQFLEHSPYCERDIRRPENLQTHDERGDFRVIVKQNDVLTEVVLDHHPLDVVGWDGYYYPWALSIHDFEPITGRLHQPPPVHQTFQGEGFVLCSFVPRLFDYHPEAVPAPYNHSNVFSDEVIYYANDEFMSRKGIRYGSLTLHPGGLPHGPHPGKAEASIGKKETKELAVMLDTFRPLKVAKAVLAVEDAEYGRSWLEGAKSPSDTMTG